MTPKTPPKSTSYPTGKKATKYPTSENPAPAKPAGYDYKGGDDGPMTSPRSLKGTR